MKELQKEDGKPTSDGHYFAGQAKKMSMWICVEEEKKEKDIIEILENVTNLPDYAFLMERDREKIERREGVRKRGRRGGKKNQSLV